MLGQKISMTISKKTIQYSIYLNAIKSKFLTSNNFQIKSYINMFGVVILIIVSATNQKRMNCCKQLKKDHNHKSFS